MTSVAEFEARMRFIRLLALVSTRFHLTWEVVGAFVRSLLRGGKNVKNVIGMPITIFLTPNYFTHRNLKPTVALDQVVASTKRLINDLEVIGITKQPTDGVKFSRSTHGPLHSSCEFDVDMHEGENSVKFAVILKVFPTADATLDAELYPFSIDSISFSEYGLHVITDIQPYDKLNQMSGIALLARLQDIRENTITQLHKYISGSSMKANVHNSALLLRTQELFDDGFLLKGDVANITTEIDEDSCAICLEERASYVSLTCSHSFCVPCISHLMTYHVDVSNTEHTCPLCRAKIEFVK